MLTQKILIPVLIFLFLQTYFACVEYCTPVLVMYEMEAEGLAGLSPMQKAAELVVFYDVLNRILSRPSAPDYCRNIKLIKYDGMRIFMSYFKTED